MKKGWKKVPLHETIEDLRTGLNPRVHFKLNTEDASGYYITVRELKGFSFEIDSYTDRIDINAVNRINERSKLKVGDVLYSGTGTIGRTALVQEPPLWWNIKEGVYAITPCANMLDSKYLIYALHSDVLVQQINAKTSGTTVKSIPMKELKNIIIPLPSLSEQQRIVEKLDKAFAKIDAIKANAEKNLQEAKDLFDAKLEEALLPQDSWGKSILSEVCAITSSLVDPQLPQYVNLLHVGGANIESKTGNLVNLLSAKEENLISGKYTFDSSMVLYSKIRPYLMKVARPNFNGLCSADMYPLKPNERVSKDFLYYILLSKAFTDYAIKGSARAGMPKVNRDHLFAYNCSYPDRQLQDVITRKLDSLAEKVNQLSLIYQNQLTECDALKQSILCKAFNGELL